MYLFRVATKTGPVKIPGIYLHRCVYIDTCVSYIGPYEGPCCINYLFIPLGVVITTHNHIIRSVIFYEPYTMSI